MSASKDLDKKLLFLTQPFSEFVIFSGYLLTMKRELLEYLFKVSAEIKDWLVRKILHKEPPNFEKDFPVIIDIIKKNLLSTVFDRVTGLTLNVREYLLDLAEILDAIPSKYDVLKLASHAIRIVLYYGLEEKSEALLRISYLLLYLITAYSVLKDLPEKEAEELYEEIILPAYEREIEKILRMVSS
ncbi:MAG: hypothetical protein DRO40_13015 [Thermoprotei archaeon]|nr:MAG: hypothetical protein DRO40_13015 [Thermoprotei archaeon]